MLHLEYHSPNAGSAAYFAAPKKKGSQIRLPFDFQGTVF
jgi:hypothetical protein